MVFSKLHSWTLLLSALSTWPLLAQADCNAHVPAFPIPALDSKSKFMRDAHKDIEKALRRLISHPEYASTSFSVAATSSSETLFEIHHTAKERNADRPGAPVIDGTSCYRIASCTKAFTALALMQQEGKGKIRFTDYINQYVAELNEPHNGTLPWPEINIWSLATQMGGIPRDLTDPDSVDHRENPQAYGLPPLQASEHLEAHCESKATNGKSCSRRDLIDFLKPLLPLFPPKQQSTYSNIGFELIGLALENVTNMSYEELIQTTILDDIGMTSSSFSTPPDSVAALPPNPWYWEYDMGVQKATGGLYSSTNDLSKFIRYILTHYNGITLSHNWIFPVSFATGMNTFYGLPWEIFRTTRILPYTRRPVTFVTKSGSLPGHTSYLVTVPDYNMGFSILVAGDGSFAKRALEIVGTTIVRHADAACHANLATKYTGTWAAPGWSGVNSSITIAHSLHRDLYVSRWISNGSDVLAELGALGFPYASKAARARQYLQLVPTFLYLDQPHLKGEVFRGIVHRVHEQKDRGVFDDLCPTDIDTGTYGGVPLNEIGYWDLRSDETGYGTVELTGFRVKLERVDDADADVDSDRHGERFVVQEL